MPDPINWSGLNRIQARLGRLETIGPEDFVPLGDRISDIVTEGNRVGVMAGTDKDGVPLTPVAYRGSKAKPVLARQGEAFGSTARRFKGFTTYTGGRKKRGVSAIQPNNNLATWQYQELDGPPLAPRGEASRVISNFGEVDPRIYSGASMVMTWAWKDVVSVKGVPFLGAHFRGANGLPKRDLAGIRPVDRAKIAEAVGQWAQWLVGGGS